MLLCVASHRLSFYIHATCHTTCHTTCQSTYHATCHVTPPVTLHVMLHVTLLLHLLHFCPHQPCRIQHRQIPLPLPKRRNYGGKKEVIMLFAALLHILKWFQKIHKGEFGVFNWLQCRMFLLCTCDPLCNSS